MNFHPSGTHSHAFHTSIPARLTMLKISAPVYPECSDPSVRLYSSLGRVIRNEQNELHTTGCVCSEQVEVHFILARFTLCVCACVCVLCVCACICV